MTSTTPRQTPSTLRQRPALVLLALLVLGALLSACGSDSDEGSGERRTATTGESGTGVSGEPDVSGEGDDVLFGDGDEGFSAEGFELVEGATDIGDYSVQMFGPPSVEVSENSFWPIIDTIYTARNGGKETRFAVSDRLEHWVEDEDAGTQAASAQFEVFEYAFVTEYNAERAITFTPDGSDVELIGHEIDFSGGGRHRSVLRDKVLYSMTARGLSDAEWEYFVNSLQTHPLEANDA